MITLCHILSCLKDKTGGDVFVIPKLTDEGPVTRYYIFPDNIKDVVLPSESTTVYEKVVRIMH